jgi:hypothetical protein
MAMNMVNRNVSENRLSFVSIGQQFGSNSKGVVHSQKYFLFALPSSLIRYSVMYIAAVIFKAKQET